MKRPLALALSLTVALAALPGCPGPNGGTDGVVDGSAVDGSGGDAGANGSGGETTPPVEDRPFSVRLSAAVRSKDPPAIARLLGEADELFVIADSGGAAAEVVAFAVNDPRRNIFYVPVFTEAARLDEFARVVGAPRRPVSLRPKAALQAALRSDNAVEVSFDKESEDEATVKREIIGKVIELLGD